MGMWTLGYDWGDPGYPALVDEVFARPVLDAVTVAGSGDLDVRITARVFPGLAATSGVRVSDDGLTWSDWLDPAPLDPAGGGLAWRLPGWPRRPSDDPSPGRRRRRHAVRRHAGRGARRPGAAGPGRAVPAARAGAGLVERARGRGRPGRVGQAEVRWTIGDALARDWAPLDSLAAGSITAPVDQPVSVEVRATDLAGRVTTGSATAPAGSWARP
ncbi:MAG: hypothetical protein U0667_00880 [Chloroflexota bacterium]